MNTFELIQAYLTLLLLRGSRNWGVDKDMKGVLWQIMDQNLRCEVVFVMRGFDSVVSDFGLSSSSPRSLVPLIHLPVSIHCIFLDTKPGDKAFPDAKSLVITQISSPGFVP